jgi:outer membrane protein assembly factor BamD (BamD/ComL family)
VSSDRRRSLLWANLTVLAAIVVGVTILELGSRLLPTTSPMTVTTPDVPATRRNVAPLSAELAQSELRFARDQADAGLHREALATLRDLVTRYAGTDAAVDGSFLIAAINEDQKQFDAALAAYLEIGERYAHHSRAPEALVRFAQVVLRSNRKQKVAEAREALASVADRYPASLWAPKALLDKGNLEERQKLREHDGSLGAEVPSALSTYRRLAIEYQDNPVTEPALARLARLYEEAKRYDMAALVWSHLASSHPDSPDDPWFHAAELYRLRLGDSAKARVAYERVPETSKYYEDARKRLK